MLKTNLLKKIVNHVRNREYMSGVERDQSRIKATGEIFTPTALVQSMLDNIPQDDFKDPLKTFLDPSCGDGQFLSEILIRKVENDIEFDIALSKIFGVDIMQDNCIECIKRIYMVNESDIDILENDDIPADWKHSAVTAVFKVNDKITNIICADGIKYNYKFYEQIIDADPVNIKKSKKEQIVKEPNVSVKEIALRDLLFTYLD